MKLKVVLSGTRLAQSIERVTLSWGSEFKPYVGCGDDLKIKVVHSLYQW